MVIQSREVLRLEEGAASSIRAAASKHQTSAFRALLASVEAREFHRRCYGAYGALGALKGPIVEEADGYRQATVGGEMKLLHNLQPNASISYDCLVEYVGLRVNEPNETYDEPYVIFSVVTLNPSYSGTDDLVRVTKIGPLESLVDGQVVGDTQTVWQDIVGGTGIKIVAAIFEQDLGDPDEVRDAIEAKIKEYAQKAASAIASAYGAGGAEAEQIAGSEVFTWIARIFSLGIVELFGLGDDVVGRNTEEVPLTEIVRLSNEREFESALQTNAEGLQFTHKMEVRSEEGDYSIYFRVRGREIPPIPRFPDLPSR